MVLLMIQWQYTCLELAVSGTQWWEQLTQMLAWLNQNSLTKNIALLNM